MDDFLNPAQILKQLNLRKNLIAADFGCGSGGWVLPLAKILTEGKIYAFDLSKEALSALRGKLKWEKIYNVDALRADVEKGTTLLAESIDLLLMTNLLFECRDKKAVLQEAKRVLKKGGKLLIVDWIEDNPLTQEIEWVNFEEVKKILNELGFKIEKEFKAGVYHQGFLVIK